MPKLKVTLNIGLSNSEQSDIIDISDDEWGDCKTDAEKDKLIDGYWIDWSSNYIDGGAWIVDE